MSEKDQGITSRRFRRGRSSTAWVRWQARCCGIARRNPAAGGGMKRRPRTNAASARTANASVVLQFDCNSCQSQQGRAWHILNSASAHLHGISNVRQKDTISSACRKVESHRRLMGQHHAIAKKKSSSTARRDLAEGRQRCSTDEGGRIARYRYQGPRRQCQHSGITLCAIAIANRMTPISQHDRSGCQTKPPRCRQRRKCEQISQQHCRTGKAMSSATAAMNREGRQAPRSPPERAANSPKQTRHCAMLPAANDGKPHYKTRGRRRW